jgi:DNA-binding transcriptional LysR family regulator
METRQLSYFILACQHKNHAEGAARSGLSASVLSENLNLLERELGLTLFQRGPLGHYPTEEARWLYQAAEPILQLAEAAETALGLPVTEPFQRLRVSSPMQFMLGRLSRAASLAAREIRKSYPALLTNIRFADQARISPPDATPVEAMETPPDGHVVLDYAESGDGGHGESTLLFPDEWLCIGPTERFADGVRTLPLETLRILPLYLPALAPAQIRLARAYCAAHNLPEPKVIHEDVGTFPLLSRDDGPFCMLAPQSLVAGGLARFNLGYARLPVDLASKVVARIETDHPAARAYVSLLKEIVQDPEPVVRYEPKITLKQMRYFLALCEQLNVTAAARKLHVVQPALSNQLRKLETVAGRKLFQRHRTGLEPLPGTRRLAELLGPAVEQSDHIVFRSAHLAVKRRERLAIGFIPMINHDGPLMRTITAALEKWGAAYPNVRLQIQEAPTQTLHRWVESGAISFALVEAHVSRTSQLDLHTRDSFGVVSRAAAAILQPGDVPLRQLADLPLVLPGDAFGLRQILDRAAGELDMRLVPQMEVNSLTMILALIRRMPLATILPQPAVRPYVEAGILQFNPIVEPAISRRLSILFSAARSLTEIERSLIATLREMLASAGFTPPPTSDSAQDEARPDRTSVH